MFAPNGSRSRYLFIVYLMIVLSCKNQIKGVCCICMSALLHLSVLEFVTTNTWRPFNKCFVFCHVNVFSSVSQWSNVSYNISPLRHCVHQLVHHYMYIPFDRVTDECLKNWNQIKCVCSICISAIFLSKTLLLPIVFRRCFIVCHVQ